MDLAQVKNILLKHVIPEGLITSPRLVYKIIAEKGIQLTEEEDLALFDAFWFLGNKKRNTDIIINNSLKLKFLTKRKRLGDLFGDVASGYLNVGNGTLVRQLIMVCELTELEQVELWRIFHIVCPSFCTREANDVDLQLGIRAIIQQKIDELGKVNVLDVGCGKEGSALEGLISIFGSKVEGFGVDLDIVDKPRYVHLVKASVERLPFPDNYFEVIYSCAVMAYFPTTTQIVIIVKEILRVLKPQGVFIFNDSGRNAQTYSERIVPQTEISCRVEKSEERQYVTLIIKK